MKWYNYAWMILVSVLVLAGFGYSVYAATPQAGSTASGAVIYQQEVRLNYDGKYFLYVKIREYSNIQQAWHYYEAQIPLENGVDLGFQDTVVEPDYIVPTKEQP